MKKTTIPLAQKSDDVACYLPLQLLSINQVISLTGLGRTKIYQEIALGHIPIIKVGSRTLVRAQSLLAWNESHSMQSPANQNEKINKDVDHE